MTIYGDISTLHKVMQSGLEWINKCGGPVQKKICGANPQDQNEMPNDSVVFNCCN